MYDVISDNSHEDEIALHSLVNQAGNVDSDTSYETLVTLKKNLEEMATRMRAQRRTNVVKALALLEGQISPLTTVNGKGGWHHPAME